MPVYEESALELASTFLTPALMAEGPVRVLEVGCGTGALTAHLIASAPAGSAIVVTDSSSAMLDLAREVVGTEAPARADHGGMYAVLRERLGARLCKRTRVGGERLLGSAFADQSPFSCCPSTC